MALVVRSNYGDESLALIAYLHQQKEQGAINEPIYVVYINTGWEANGWLERVTAAQQKVESLGFTPVQLQPKISLPDMVRDRGRFPSKKFQWCAGFVKGLPLIDWLDTLDSACEFTILLPKRQENYRKPIPKVIEECEYHGDRRVFHPILNMSRSERDALIGQLGFKVLHTRSKECDPCVNSTIQDIQQLDKQDIQKAQLLEKQIETPIFQKGIFGSSSDINDIVKWAKGQSNETAKLDGDSFSMGCGDPFGCGL